MIKIINFYAPTFAFRPLRIFLLLIRRLNLLLIIANENDLRGGIEIGKRPPAGSSRETPLYRTVSSPGSAHLQCALCCSFEEGKSDKEILDNLLQSTRYDKRLLPPVQGTLSPPSRLGDYTPLPPPFSISSPSDPRSSRAPQTSPAPLPPHSTTQPQLTAHPSL